MEVSQTACCQVFACALETSCSEPNIQARCERNDVELKQQIAELLQQQEFKFELKLKSHFDFDVLDKFEALILKNKLMETRRFVTLRNCWFFYGAPRPRFGIACHKE